MWRDGQRRIARYTNLDPGDYLFRIRATNPDGFLNENEFRLLLSIQPAFYQTWWFRSVCVLTCITIVVAIARIRRAFYLQQQDLALYAARSRFAQRLHTDLGSEITALRSAISLPASEEEREILTRRLNSLSSTHRDLIWRIHPDDDHLSTTIEFLVDQARTYLQDAGISFRLQKPLQCPDSKLTGEKREAIQLAVREALQNIVKHAHASTVTIDFDCEIDSATITISDDGVGNSSKKPAVAHHGIKDMRALVNGIGGSVAINSTPGSGTTVRLSFPVTA